MLFKANRLSSKPTLVYRLFSLVLVSVVAVLVFLGFRQTQQNATERGTAGLADQEREALRKFTEREGEIASRR